MANSVCSNGRLDDAKYAAPLPVIGLYIAAASLFCMSIIFYDVVAGLRKGKRWLPCNLFSLNSVTLTLLAAATKLPLDLTTPMPSVQDQFSKLSGTTLLCVAMCFLMPSLGSKNDSQCLANMAALSILVITVIVNICIQMSTGVIALFVPEHIAILSCMLILLLVLWISAFSIDIRRGFSVEQNKSILLMGQKSLLGRLKMCYVHSYNSDPQFVICKHPISASVSGLLLISLAILLQSAYRAFVIGQLKFCAGTSVYGWSIWPIIAIQIFTVITGSLAGSIRWLTSFKHMDLSCIYDFEKQDPNSVLNLNRVVGVTTLASWVPKLSSVFVGMIILLKKLIIFWTTIVYRFLQILTLLSTCWVIFSRNEVAEELEDLIDESGEELDKSSIKQRMSDMRKWMEVSKSELPNNLIKLFSRIPPSENVRAMDVRDQMYPNLEGFEVSVLSMVLLVKIAEYSIPSSKSLVQAFNEAYEIVLLIDSKINSVNLTNRKKSNLAKALWKDDVLSYYFRRASERSIPDLFATNSIIIELKHFMPNAVYMSHEVGIAADLILDKFWKSYSSIDELHAYIEQLVVDMLHVSLSQLPSAIYKEVMESPAECYEETLKDVIHYIYRVEPLDAHIRWAFPPGCQISSLIVDSIPFATQSHLDIVEEDNAVTLLVSQDMDENVQRTLDDVPL